MRGPAQADRGVPLRVACLSETYPLLTFTVVWREAQALRAQGMDVEPFSVWRPSPGEALGGGEVSRTSYLAEAGAREILGAHAVLLATRPARYVRAVLLTLRTGTPGWGRRPGIRRLTWAALLVRQMRARGLAHLHVDGTSAGSAVAMIAAELGGIPFSVTVHGPRAFFMVKARHLDEKLRRARFVRCISHFCRSQCLLWVSRDHWPRIHVVHCGIDTADYAPRVHEGAGSHVLFVGRPGVRKGLSFLLEAVARLRAERPDVRLTVVGDGPERAEAEATAQAAGIGDRVQFTGYQSSAQVAEWLSRADVFVLPSLAEGVPIVLMEAMAAGVPVVATNVGGTSELVVDGENGFLVPPTVTDALVSRIGQLLDDPELRGRLGRAGRETVVRDFSLERNTARLRDLLASAVAGEGTTEPEGVVASHGPAGSVSTESGSRQPHVAAGDPTK